jgi:hypothetical protein
MLASACGQAETAPLWLISPGFSCIHPWATDSAANVLESGDAGHPSFARIRSV